MLATPVDGGSLALFRIAFGTVMMLQAGTFLWSDMPTGNWAETYFTGDHVTWNFPYPGFEWLRALPLSAMNLVSFLMWLAGISLALGFYHRVASAIVFFTWTYVWMIDEGLYNNHYYLMSLVAWLLIWMPASERYSVHDWIRLRLCFSSAKRDPSSTGSVPFWTLFLLRTQLLVVYFYGGVAKICWQWLEHAEPVGMALKHPVVAERLQAGLPAGLAEYALSVIASREFAFFLAYSGLAFDLAIGFLLIIRRTRIFAILLVVMFHAFNHYVLFDDIGWFPLMGTLLTLIFLEPDWPQRCWNGLRSRTWLKPDWRWLLGGMVAVPLVGAALGWKRNPTPSQFAGQPTRLRGWVAILVCGWALVQIILPLQHFLIPGDVNWTSEGGRFSWRMKIAHKTSPSLRFHITDRSLLAYDREGKPLVDWQAWQGPKIIYRQVDSRTVDWRKMPEWMVFFQPLYGECIFFNPWAGQAEKPLSTEEASKKVNEFWKKTYGRLPKTYHSANLSDVLLSIERRMEKGGSPQSLLDEIRETRDLADQMLDPEHDEETLLKLLSQVHENLRLLIQIPIYGPDLRLYLSRTHPMASQGSLEPEVPFIVVEDMPLMVLSPKQYVVLQRNRFGSPWEGSESVYCDLYHCSFHEWESFPRTMLIVDEHDTMKLHWNPRAELMKFQCQVMRVRPYLVHQYAQRVADQWQQMYGYRPRVHVTNFASLVPGPLQSLIDPRADLASAEINYLSHNDWIVLSDKRRKSALEQQVEKSDSFSN